MTMFRFAKRALLRSTVSVGVLSILLWHVSASNAQERDGQKDHIESGFSFTKNESHLKISLDGNPIATYVWSDSKTTRPYFKQIKAVGGEVQLTRNHPPKDGDFDDHQTYHPGIWWGFGDVGGNDYWRMKAKVVGGNYTQEPTANANTMSFAVRNKLMTTQGDETFCVQNCRYTFHRRDQGILMICESEFVREASDFWLGDQEEMGLAFRVATSLSSKNGGTIWDSEGRTDLKQIRTNQSDWCDYSGAIVNRKGIRKFGGLMLMNDPNNFRKPWWHAVDTGLLVANPLGQSELTGNGKKRKNVLVKKGEPFRLRYGCLIHLNDSAEEFNAEKAYEDFLSVSANSNVKQEQRRDKKSSAGSQKQPNILFIVSDDHGWGDLPSNWAKTEVRLPRLEALAEKGVRFPNYHTVPLCGPSRACMFTGQYSSENGMWRGPGNQPLGSPGYRGIKRDVKMLSQCLSQAGYSTGAFGKWHMGSLKGEVPNDRGFDEFRGFLKGAHPYWITEKRSNIMHNRQQDKKSIGHATELFTQWAEEFIRKSAESKEPFFCYLAYNAVHGPLRVDKSKPASAPEEWVNAALHRGVSFLRSDYVAILEHMDHNIGRLVDLLEELDVAENTLIVFVSDNGGCTMEEGAAGGRFPGNNGPFRGGKGTTYQGGLNVPLLMNWKGRLPQRIVSEGQVMHCDIFSTLLDVASIPVPETNGKNSVRGISLMPHMLSSGEEAIPERTMIFELWGNIGLRKGNYKLWSDIGREHSSDWEALVTELKQTDLELFDLSKDIDEKNDLRTNEPEVYASLKTELIDHFANINAEYPGAKSVETESSENSKGDESERQKNANSLASGISSRDQFLKNRDRNGDGELTLEEYIGNPAGRNVPALTKRFKKFDSNGDGKLQLKELKK